MPAPFLFLKRALVASLWAASAVVYADYTPDVAEFDSTNTLRFASNPVLSLVNGGTIEFWVAPAWEDDPGYAPVIVSNVPEGSAPVYEISLTGAKDALGIQAGDQYGRITFDFSDGAMHHVAISDYMDSIYVMIDGAIVGAVQMSFLDSAGTDLWIGAGDGNGRPFAGAIAALRVWEGALPLEAIAEYALRDPHDAAAPHPSLDTLLAESDFQNNDLMVVPIVRVDLDPDLATAIPGE